MRIFLLLLGVVAVICSPAQAGASKYEGKLLAIEENMARLEKVNYKLSSGFSTPVEVAQPLDLFCSTPSAIPVTQCQWFSSAGNEYNVHADGSVTDEGGFLVGDVFGHTGDPSNCSITNLFTQLNDFGDWRCRIHHEQSTQFQESVLAVMNEPRVTDDSIRLPTAIAPTKYDLSLIPYIIVDNFTIDGAVEIDVNVLSDANTIVMHINDMIVYEDSVAVTNEGSDIAVTGHGYDAARQFYIIFLESTMTAGTTAHITINFLGNLNDQLAGFYRSDYQDSQGATKYMATTQFEAADARRAFPCFDEPAMKATFVTNLGRLKTMSSISNMPIAEEGVPMQISDDYVWDVYEESVGMSTYLLAFVVSEFGYTTSPPSGNGVEIWANPTVLDSTQYAAQTGPQILEFYEGYFNVPYPLPKQDMIGVPDFSAGAMENWGLITYREIYILYDPATSSLAQRESVATVMAHELAHQWFGDLVTMEWWTDLWLNEGFATYTQYIGTNHVEPDTDYINRFSLNSIHPAFEADALESSHPISTPANHPDDIMENFDAITYEKGSSVVRMMANFMGVDTFNRGIENYLNKYAYSNAKQDDLWAELTAVALEDGSLEPDLTVKLIMDTWTLQMGFPVVTCLRETDGLSMQCSQDRFLISAPETKQNDYTWYVPLSYAEAGVSDFSGTQVSSWLRPSDSGPVSVDTSALSDPNNALIVNVQQTGFYRVNYDNDNWAKISSQLQADHNGIHRINRAQVLNDGFSLAQNGLLAYDVALGQTVYLSLEDNFIPWSAALSGFAYVNLMLRRSQDYQYYIDYLTAAMEPTYNALGFDPDDVNDSLLDILLRDKIVSNMCSLGYSSCLSESVSLFDSWMAEVDPDLVNPIDADQRDVVYCTAIGQGDQSEWDFLWQRYLNSPVATEKATILYALGCSQDTSILQSYLDMIFDPNSELRTQDVSTVFNSIASNVDGRDLAWQWLNDNWNTIIDNLDTAISSPVGGMVTTVTKDFNTQQDLTELESFYNTNVDNLGTAQRATETALLRTETNILWMTDYYDIIVNWLSTHQPV